MIRLFLNALAASAGAGLTYVRNVVPCLASRADVHTTVALDRRLRREFGEFGNVSFVEWEPGAATRRFWQEQTMLPKMIRETQADVLLSTGNFALRKSPVPQILLSGNSLYTSSDFSRDLWSRHEYGLWFDTRLRAIFAKRSIAWADVTVAPSQAFAKTLSEWTGNKVFAIYHGFDPEAFFRDRSPLPPEIQEKLKSTEGCFKLLFVSHYNYYRNFETLLRSLPRLRQRLGGRPIRLLLTCKFQPGTNPGSYRTETASRLVQELGIGQEVVELGSVPYSQLAQVYRAADAYVTPAYAETFAHPLVEAMASGIPVIAADTAVHREVCGPAALYFSTFSPESIAERVAALAASEQAKREMTEAGRRRSQDFSWARHVAQILELANSLKGKQREKS